MSGLIKKFKRKFLTDGEQEYMAKLRAEAREGEDVRNQAAGIEVLRKHILEPLEKTAYEAFVNVDPSDTNKIIETQVWHKLLKEIDQAIDLKIQNGINATQQLAELNSTQEDEP